MEIGLKVRCMVSVISAAFHVEGGRLSCGVNKWKAKLRHCWLPISANKLNSQDVCLDFETLRFTREKKQSKRHKGNMV